MNKLLNTLLTYSLVLFALSLAIPTYGQPPSTRKEGGDGNNGDCNLDINLDINQNVIYVISLTDTSYLDSCDLHAGYYLNNESITYVEISGFTWSSTDNSYIVQIPITFTPSQINNMCENGFGFYFGLYCLVDGEYEIIEVEDDDLVLPISLCCEEIEFTGDDPIRTGSGNGYFISNSNADIFNLDLTRDQNSVSNNSLLSPTQVDYNIYDLHGNHISTYNGVSTNQKLQDAISRLDIDTGIYFIRYIDNGKVKTKKIFKL